MNPGQHHCQQPRAAYAEVQEEQSALTLMAVRGIEIPEVVVDTVDRLGGLVYGLLRFERRG